MISVVTNTIGQIMTPAVKLKFKKRPSMICKFNGGKPKKASKEMIFTPIISANIALVRNMEESMMYKLVFLLFKIEFMVRLKDKIFLLLWLDENFQIQFLLLPKED